MKKVVLYIGSTDAGTQGYFIIETEGEAEVMQAWYDQRIAKENLHLEDALFNELSAFCEFGQLSSVSMKL